MYATAEDIDTYFTGEKLYYMRHTSAGATPIKMNLADYRGKMGRLVDAGGLLKAIAGSGHDMKLPNIYLAPEQSVTLPLAKYGVVGATQAEAENSAIVDVVLDNGSMTVTAKSVGQTKVTVVADKEHTIIVTVREGASDNGWL